MKKILSLLLGLSLVLTASAQLVTSAENGSVKLEFGGFVDDQTVIKVTNKQSCTVDIRVSTTGNVQTTITLPANSTDTVRLTLSGTKAKVWANPKTNCAEPGKELATLELELNIVALPIYFTKFFIKKRAKTS